MKSRLEVETTFRESEIKTTVLRAGLIIGPEGSSFSILQRLIERLPLMICPAWTKTLSQPVALKDVIRILEKVLRDRKIQNAIYDLGGPQIVTYQDLIAKTAAQIRKSRTLYTLNIIPLAISRFWVCLITGMPKNLVYPLVLSLRHEMLAQPDHQWPYHEDLQTSLEEALQEALLSHPRHHFKCYIPAHKAIRSS